MGRASRRKKEAGQAKAAQAKLPEDEQSVGKLLEEYSFGLTTDFHARLVLLLVALHRGSRPCVKVINTATRPPTKVGYLSTSKVRLKPFEFLVERHNGGWTGDVTRQLEEQGLAENTGRKIDQTNPAMRAVGAVVAEVWRWTP